MTSPPGAELPPQTPALADPARSAAEAAPPGPRTPQERLDDSWVSASRPPAAAMVCWRGPVPYSEPDLSQRGRLNLLFEAVLAPRDERGHRRQWTAAEVAAAIPDAPVTEDQISRARSGAAPLDPAPAAAVATAFETLSGVTAEATVEPSLPSAIVFYLSVDPATAEPGERTQLAALDEQIRELVRLRGVRELMARLETDERRRQQRWWRRVLGWRRPGRG
ncbi:hypothetical protein [uncultured Pseudonocardia sp.]|uniref:hypothetical protein n=1 Tax=uncultured Pseudonocardia sp. TaxID=211455 RepID=UPI00263A19C6|nr:hypothetical protein [uncultured Pseudonocardia sp.]